MYKLLFHCLQHDAGPLQDGSVVKEVADNTVYMKAIFTPQSLDDFNTSFEDSFNSPPEWNQALLLLNQFCVEFQSAFAPTNTERKPRFVLVIERFGLYNLHEGFYSKNEPKYVMADPEVQAKAEEMEKELLDRRREEAVETETESQNPSDVPLSVLLELMGQSSIADSTPVVSQCEEEECTDETEPSGSDLNTAHMLQSALEKMRCLNCEEFVVSAEDQAVLDAILEWKNDYVPPSSESSEEQQSKPSMGASLDVMFENPTLQHDIGRIPDPPSSVTTSQHKTKRGADCVQAEEITEGNEPSASAHKGTNSNATTPCVTPVDSQAVTVEESAGAQDNTEAGKGLDDRGIPKSVASSAQCWSRANQQAPDSSDTSKSSADCSTNHPDVAFSSSSLSNLGEHSSSMEGAPTSLSVSAACLPSAEPSGATQAEGDSELHHRQHVQPGHINANIVSVDKGQEISKHSDIHHKSTENTKPCKVLVECSGSSDSEDAFDRELMQQVNGQRSARNPAPDHPGSSGETVVVPDSSQEDVIVISSSSGNRRMNTSQNKGSEKDDRYVRNDQTTTSSKHAHNDKAKTVSSPSASRNTTPVYVRQKQLESSSETEEEETVTETESSTEDLADCMRTNFRAWLEYTSRLEDPKQKRLRQLKLTHDVLKKVEECLGRLST
ncbi:hypothetical protein ACOMHN_011064 [Nucella lapillus]